MKLQVFLALLVLAASAAAWGNGFSVQNTPTFADAPNKWARIDMYGTHDYLAQAALRFLPAEERRWVQNNTYFYGTELPDSGDYDESINDRNAQYLRFDGAGRALDDSLAQRAMAKYDYLISALQKGQNATASKWAGVQASYVSDAGLFSRVIETSENGYTFEGYVLQMSHMAYPSQKFEEKFGQYIKFDGRLEMISPYDAIMRVGRATYMGDGSCSAQWMEDNYDTEDPKFMECAGGDLNLIVNAIADVLHTAYQSGVKGQGYELYAYDWENPAEEPKTPAQPPAQPPVQPSAQPPAEPPAQPPEQPPVRSAAGNDNSLLIYVAIAAVAVAAVIIALYMLRFRRGEERVKAIVGKLEKPEKGAKKKAPKAKKPEASPAAKAAVKSANIEKTKQELKKALKTDWTEEEEEIEGKPEEEDQ